jgi:hypothetical protein
MNIWPAVSYVIEKIPFDKIFDRPRDNRKDMRELAEILRSNPVSSTPVPAEKPKVEVKPNINTTSAVTTQETVNYQNRELGKVLIQMERHAAQGFKIPTASGPTSCDCGTKHLPDLESLCEETIPMVSDPVIYLKIMDWVKDISPKITPEANDGGLYTKEYPGMAVQARDFRKQLLGTLDYKALFWDKKLEQIQEEKAVKEPVTALDIPAELSKESEYAPETIIHDQKEPVAEVKENIPENITDLKNSETDTQEITDNGTVCQELKPMAEWIAGQDQEKCRTCMLTVTVPWYYEELEERGLNDTAEDLETLQKEGDPIKIAAALDQIKEQVDAETKQRLLEFDCATQSLDVSDAP